MKNIKLLSLLLIAFIGFNACDQEDDLVFTAQAPTEGINFSNSFLDEYVLTVAASNNLGERFTWQNANFGIPTNVTYELENSVIGDFTDVTTVGTTSGNELAVTIGQMLDFATAAGLDNDPNTEALNIGALYFRIKAFVGTEGLDTFSAIQILNVTLPEAADNSGPQPNCDSVWVVGAGAVDAGWNWDSPIEFLCFDNVYVTNINLTNDGFRFFLTEGDWDSGQNFPFYANDGYTIDSDFVDAMDGDNNFSFIGTPGNYLMTVDTINKTITLGPPDAEDANCDSVWVVGAGAVDAGWNWDSPIEFSCTDNVYSTNINLTNDGFRFFLTEGDWDSGQNHPYYVSEGYTIDSDLVDAMDGDNNFSFIGTPGKYLMTVDTVNKTITLGNPRAEEANCDSVWVVGAGAVDAGWNWDNPIEFACTDGYYSTNINLINDSFRFFLTEGDWDSGQNHPYYISEEYTIHSDLVDAMDGDNNFNFTGTPGIYYLSVDTVNKVIDLR